MRNNIYWLSPGCAGFKYAVCPALDGRFFWVRYAEEFLEAEMEEVWRDAELCPVVVVNFGESWRARERGATRTMSITSASLTHGEYHMCADACTHKEAY